MSVQTFRQRKGVAAYTAVQRMAPRRSVERRRNSEPDWLTFTRRGENRLLALMCVVSAAMWILHFARLLP